MGATVDKARWTVWLAKPYGGRSRNPAQNCSAITLNAEEEANYTRSSSIKISRGFLHQYFAEEILMLLDSNRAEMPHQQITTIKRLWDVKNFYTWRRMWRHDQHPTQQVSWKKHEGGYRKYNCMSGGNKDHTAQPPREGESLSNRGKGSGRSFGRGWDGQRCSQLGSHTERVIKLDRSSVTCFNYQKLGHYRSECPEPRVRLSRIHSPDCTLPEGKTVCG